jgi:translation initiation factor 2D
MRNGADLMTPGLARGPPFPAKAKKGSIVAVAAFEKPSVPVVVGACEIDVSALTEVRGVKGHAVRGIHWEGDEIWSWSQGGRPTGVAAPEVLKGWDDDSVESVAQNVAAVRLQDSDAEGSTGEGPADNEHRNLAPEPGGIAGATVFEEVDMPKKTWATKGMHPFQC